MKVRCISQKGELLTEQYIDPRRGLTRDHDFNLTLDKDYVIYALAVRGNQVWYYIVDDCEGWFPINRPAPLFRVIDDRVSRFWTIKLTPGNPDHDILFAFEEWDSDDRFYDRLTDRSPLEVSAFVARKLLMDEEFSEKQRTSETDHQL